MPSKVKRTRQKVANKVLEKAAINNAEGAGLREIYQTAKRVVSKLIFGDNSLPQNVIKFLKENGEAKLMSASINRKPISKAINIALNVASWGQFEENMSKTPMTNYFT